MSGNRKREGHSPDRIKRLPPPRRAGRLEERCRNRHEVADHRDAGAGIVDPEIGIADGARGHVQVKGPAADRPLAARAHDDIRAQHVALGHRRDEDPDLLFLGVGQLGVIQHRPCGFETARQESALGERPVDGIRRVDRRTRERGLDAAIAARVIEMPVCVQDRDDGPLALARPRQDGAAVPVVTAGVDDDEPLGCVEHHRVAVRTAPGEDRTAQEFDARRDGFRGRRRRGRGTCRRGLRQGEDPGCHRAHSVTPSAAPARAVPATAMLGCGWPIAAHACDRPCVGCANFRKRYGR